MVMKYVNWFFRIQGEDREIPECPDHKVHMLLRGHIGRPAMFSRQTGGEYTHIYFCGIEGCNQTAERKVVRTQAPMPGEPPERPLYARQNDNTHR
ncbi:hypothetical protein BH23CHL5_BH23CHL5_12690 [soil metagenome]